MFHQACPDHGGDMDLHAEELQVIKTGGKRPEQAISSERVIAAVALGLPAGVCLYFLWKQRQQSR